MTAAERFGSRGLTVLLASQEPADINATVQGIRRVFPVDRERQRSFVVVQELPKGPHGQKIVDIRERVEILGKSSMIQLYEGPLSQIRNLLRLAHISSDTFRAVAPHVLIVTQLQPQSQHHREPREKLSLHRGFIDAQSRVDAAIHRNDSSQYPVDFDVVLGLRSVYFAFPEGDLHMECVVVKDRKGPQTRSTSASGIVDNHSQTGDLIEREELLLHPIELALRNLKRLREQERQTR